MTDQRTNVEEGVVIEYEGKYWGLVYNDGYIHQKGWVGLEKAEIHDPKYCLKPEHATYQGSRDIEELQKGRFVLIKRTTQITDQLG